MLKKQYIDVFFCCRFPLHYKWSSENQPKSRANVQVTKANTGEIYAVFSLVKSSWGFLKNWILNLELLAGVCVWVVHVFLCLDISISHKGCLSVVNHKHMDVSSHLMAVIKMKLGHLQGLTQPLYLVVHCIHLFPTKDEELCCLPLRRCRTPFLSDRMKKQTVCCLPMKQV